MNEGMMRLCFFGMLLICGLVAGRIFCGKVCPAGFAQDLLFKIPFLVKIKIFKLDRHLRRLKYVAVLINIVLPVLTLFGLYHKAQNSDGAINGAGNPIITVTAPIIMIVIAVIIRRPLCKYLCPVGAFSSLFNKVSLYKYKVSNDVCNQCGLCSKKCKMDISPSKQTGSLECIRCGVCKKACPQAAITGGFFANAPTIKGKEENP